MNKTVQEEIAELKERIAEIESIKYPGLMVLSALDSHRKKLKKLEALEEREKDGVKK
mgnify:CR=1 FL=1